MAADYSQLFKRELGSIDSILSRDRTSCKTDDCKGENKMLHTFIANIFTNINNFYKFA